jgi:deoxycytidine triphosphate deaminase
VALGHPSGATEEYALFKVPRLEGGRVQWRPVLLGHEVTHVAAERHGSVAVFDLQPKFDFTLAGTLPNPEARASGPVSTIAAGLYRIAEHWATELICDLMALQRFGPAAVASLAEYFECIGAMESCSNTHPPGVLRLRVLLDVLGPVTDPRLRSIIEPWQNAAPTLLKLTDPWAQYLSDLFVSNAPALTSAVNALSADRYDAVSRSDWIHTIADCLAWGRPGREARLNNGHTESARDSDVINAVWVARVENSLTPVDRLAQKTLESINFVTRWRATGAAIPGEIHDLTADVAAVLKAESGSSVLSADRILDRLRLDDHEKGLVATPLCHLPQGVALDVRLGNKFIVFRRSDVAAFDPLALDNDPRALQDFIELAPNDRFVLHPNEVVLGATMEYLVLPDDLSGQVITRSSYGRLGLLSATAVQVHPRFRGCLTLELVNLSTIPISLTPGERIAQLILWKSQAVPNSDVKYSHSIGPEFSRVRTDAEAGTLRALRSP